MEKFSENTKCIKCGYDWDEVGSNPPYTEYKVGVFNTVKQENWFDNICDCNKEYLMRTCCRCEYKWVEKCIPVEEKGSGVSFTCSGRVECKKDSKLSVALSNLFLTGDTGHTELSEFGYSGPFVVNEETTYESYSNQLCSSFTIESLKRKEQAK